LLKRIDNQLDESDMGAIAEQKEQFKKEC